MTPNTPTDEIWMQRALTLARETIGLASPNPQVGCVLVRDGILLGEGAHRYEQKDHAEIVALKQASAAGHSVRGATAYVTLEPCSHHGRTGPCADALIAAGIARVVAATIDANFEVGGRGFQKLLAAGIAVEVGLLQPEARALNDSFAYSVTHGRAHVTLKAALSVDGHLAPAPALCRPGEPFWITGPESRAEVHRLRHASDAILTGIGTVLADDPLLTDRSALPRRCPLLRIVLDSHLRLPLTAKLVTSVDDDLWVLCHHSAERARAVALEQRGVRVLPVFGNEGTSRGVDLEILFDQLHKSAITSLLLEAGSRLNGSFLTANLVDRIVLFYSPLELGPDALPFAQTPTGLISPFALEQRLLHIDRRPFGPDVMISGNLHNPWSQASNPPAHSE